MFYNRALNFLEALNIDTEEADDCHTGWKQLSMMFEGEDRKALQSLIDKGTITKESQKMPKFTLDAIGTTMKSGELSGTSGMSYTPMFANSLMRVSMPHLLIYVPSSPNTNLTTPKL